MSTNKNKTSAKESPISVEQIKENIDLKCHEIIRFCTGESVETSFYLFEQSLKNYVSQLGCLFLQLFLMSSQEKLDYSKYLKAPHPGAGLNLPSNFF